MTFPYSSTDHIVIREDGTVDTGQNPNWSASSSTSASSPSSTRASTKNSDLGDLAERVNALANEVAELRAAQEATSSTTRRLAMLTVRDDGLRRRLLGAPARRRQDGADDLEVSDTGGGRQLVTDQADRDAMTLQDWIALGIAPVAHSRIRR